ncbi:DCN1-like protein 2 [Dunaliella salina]|uniref:Defective in cullin neddylation protein n=1 Tax=Dunaliella salina TaxID=3046 RepID=A0ABQ7FYC8_DUNSA|nr:DCN1-like protein 2 [Dunaliella salina]|eukprot:KAF5827375.1 DCN1-like protein 2 [Dunaliella salina]
MNRMTKPQKEKAAQFKSITGASDKVAFDSLKAANWMLEAAIDYYFASGLSATTPGVDPKAVDQMFSAYKDPDEDVIGAEGIMKLCEDLGIEPADIVMLVIAFHMNAAAMGEFTKAEFSEGMLKMGVDSVDKLKKKLPELREELNNPDRFHDIYNYAYMFSREKGQKCVHLETAVGMWQLLFSGNRWPLVNEWCDFLQKHHNRAISKDTWTQLYDFIKTVKPDFSNFEESSSAWPYLIDEFVEHIRETRT